MFSRDDNNIITSINVEQLLKEIDDRGANVASDVFIPNDAWRDRKLVKEVADFIAAKSGRTTRLTNEKVLCNCSRKSGTTSRQYFQGSLHKDCAFKIVCATTKYKRSIGEKQARNGASWCDGVTVHISSKSILEHSGSCKPSAGQQQMTHLRSGMYVQTISQLSLYQLVNIYMKQGTLDSYMIKSIVQSQWPANKNIKKQNIFNIKVRVRRLSKFMSKVETFDEFQALANNADRIAGLDDISISDNEIVDIAKEIWKEIMDSQANHKDSIVTFIEYMSILKEWNNAFAYTFLRDASNQVTECIWQTGYMRDNFEWFGSFIYLDTMKRGINQLLWPYMAVSMYNEIEEISVGCEAIMYGERIEAYRDSIQFCTENSNRKKEDILVCAADGFMTQYMITESFGLSNCHFMAD